MKVNVKLSGEHDHSTDVAQWEVTKAIATMRKHAREAPLAPVQQIYNVETDIKWFGFCDKHSSHGPYYERHLHLPNLPTQREDIVFIGHYTKMAKMFLRLTATRIVG